MKFVCSYSGGKDSVLALHRMAAIGHRPVALAIVFDDEAGRSWWHGLDGALIDEIESSIGTPVLRACTTGRGYDAAMRGALEEARGLGAEAAVFGDIDIAGHRGWGSEIARDAGLEPIFPLWGRDRRENTLEAVSLGYRCLIKCVSIRALPPRFVGRTLCEGLLDDLASEGADLCGENGEYHTLVTSGPAFSRPIEVETAGVIRTKNTWAADIRIVPNSNIPIR